MNIVADVTYKENDPSCSILLVDANDDERNALAMLLQNNHYRVYSTNSGIEALELAKKYSIDMVIADSNVLGLNGLVTIQKIKQAYTNVFIPALLLIDAQTVDERHAYFQIVEHLLHRPIDELELLAKLQACRRIYDWQNQISTEKEALNYYKEMLTTEQEIAKKVYDNIIHSSALNADNIQYRLSPMSTFNGDMLLAARKPTGGIHLLLGDFTGHGLPAAIGALPASDVFYTMTRKGLSMQAILKEINYKLTLMLPPGIFCAAGFLDFEPGEDTICLWNGGLPDFVIYTPHKGIKTLINSKNIPLGITEDISFTNTEQCEAITKEDYLYMFSDGVIEAENSKGVMFGEQRLLSLFVTGQKQGVFSAINQEVDRFIGRKRQKDDITLVEFQCDI